MDKPHGKGFICSKHKIGCINQCPSCAFEYDAKKKKHVLSDFDKRQIHEFAYFQKAISEHRRKL